MKGIKFDSNSTEVAAKTEKKGWLHSYLHIRKQRF